jgi:hypothetical protein
MATLPLLNPIVARSNNPQIVPLENRENNGMIPLQVAVKTESPGKSLKRVHSRSSVTASDDNIQSPDHHRQKAESDTHTPTPASSGDGSPRQDEATHKKRRKERAKVSYKCYTQSDMQTAYKLYIESKHLGNTISIRRLAKVTGIPYATLRDHINGRKNKSSGLSGEMEKANTVIRAASQLPVLPSGFEGAALSQPSVQTLLAAALQSKVARTSVLATAPQLQKQQQQVVCQSRVVPSSAVVANPIASRVKVPTIQIVPEMQQRKISPTSVIVVPPSVVVAPQQQHQQQLQKQHQQQETHGVQDVLRYVLAEGELSKYCEAMVDHDLAFLKQLELVKTVNLSINKNAVSAQQLRALMRTGVDYFSPFFSRRCKLNEAARIAATTGQGITASNDRRATMLGFFQQKLLSQSVEILQSNSLEWVHGLRFSELALKSIAALHAGGMFKAVLSQEMVQTICQQLCPVWVSLEQSLSVALKKIQEAIIVRAVRGSVGVGLGVGVGVGSSTSTDDDLVREYLQALSKADEMRMLIIGQAEKMLEDDILVLAFRIELFDKYLEASSLGLQDPCRDLLADCKLHLIDILKSVYTLDLSMAPR